LGASSDVFFASNKEAATGFFAWSLLTPNNEVVAAGGLAGFV
jgi:hypothetical protein